MGFNRTPWPTKQTPMKCTSSTSPTPRQVAVRIRQKLEMLTTSQTHNTWPQLMPPSPLKKLNLPSRLSRRSTLTLTTDLHCQILLTTSHLSLPIAEPSQLAQLRRSRQAADSAS